MNNNTFIEQIFNPYQEAWKVLKGLQNLSSEDKSEEMDKQWEDWVKKTDEFKAVDPDNPYRNILYRMLLDAGDVIGKMNG